MKSNYAQWLERAHRFGAQAWTQTRLFFARTDVRLVWSWVKEPAAIFTLVFCGATAVAQPFHVPSGSMEPTLAIGDAVLAAKFPYGYDLYSLPFANGPTPKTRLFQHMPRVGDVVVFRLPRDTTQTYVKRVVGLPGDRLQMKHGHLWINGKKLPLRSDGVGTLETEDGRYVEVPKYIETLPDGRQHPIFKWQWDGVADNTGVYVVPPGHLFMMGDNRDDSLDSRFSPDGQVLGVGYVGEGKGVGYVPVGDLVGRAFVVIGSVDFKNASGLWQWPLLFRFARVLDWIG